MAAVTAAVIVAGIGLVVGTALQIKQAKAQQEAADEQKKQAKVEAARGRRRVLREQRIKSSQALNAAAQTGATGAGSSGIAGGLASASSQAGTELGYIGSIEQSNKRIASAESKASRFALGAGIVKGATSFATSTLGTDFG